MKINTYPIDPHYDILRDQIILDINYFDQDKGSIIMKYCKKDNKLWISTSNIIEGSIIFHPYEEPNLIRIEYTYKDLTDNAYIGYIEDYCQLGHGVYKNDYQELLAYPDEIIRFLAENWQIIN